MAALLAVAMMLQMLPMLAFADGTTGTGETYVAWNENQGNKGYTTLKAAVAEAKSGETIILGAGNYTLYNKIDKAKIKDKDLTFVGQGRDQTVLRSRTRSFSAQSITAITALMVPEKLPSKI